MQDSMSNMTHRVHGEVGNNICICLRLWHREELMPWPWDFGLYYITEQNQPI